MVKALMVDVDGVLIGGRPKDGRHWSTSLKADLGLWPEDLHREFFADHWNDIVIGRARLEDRLPEVLQRIAPHVTPDRLIEYWFQQDARLDRRLLQDLRELRSRGFQIHLATNQEHRRAQYLMRTLGLADAVDGIQYSAQIGAKKPDVAFFQSATSGVGLLPADILLIDDTPENVRAARAYGWEAILWAGEESLLDVLNEHFRANLLSTSSKCREPMSQERHYETLVMSELLHRPPAAVIFDMDGLLLDTEVLYRDAILSACSELGYAMDPDIHRSMIGVPTDRVNDILLESFGPEFPLVRFYGHCSVYVEARCQEAVPTKMGALELLEVLKVQGIPTGVATSTDRETATHHLKSTGLLDLLDTVVTRDDVRHRKPHPETYLMAAERLGVDPTNCWALEDSYNGIRSAHAAGMATIMIPDLLEPTEEIVNLCVAVLSSLSSVRDALNRIWLETSNFR